MASFWAIALLIRDALLGTFGLILGGLYSHLHVPPQDLTGKVAIVTGANSGIGYELALGLARSGATVYLACRSLTRGQAAADSIVRAVGSSEVESRVKVIQLDTSSLASAHNFAASWPAASGGKKIDILYHNAGITSTPTGQQASGTDERLGVLYATNFLGSFVLTNLLEQQLSPTARVIFTSSAGQYGGNLKRALKYPRGLSGNNIPDHGIYGDTKLMQVVFAHLLQKRWDRKTDGSKRTAHAFAPGFVFTPLFEKTRSLPFLVDPAFYVLKASTWAAISAEQGAATGLWLAGSQASGVLEGGGYWDRMVRRRTVCDVVDEGKLGKIWGVWEKDGDVRWE